MTKPTEVEQPKIAAHNIEAIVALERAALERRSWATRLGDMITSGLGTMTAVFVHIALIAAWCLVNSGWMPFVKPFDPFPFGLMTLFVSLEGVLVAMFVLITQNRMSKQADRRAHLNLQIDMLAEQEMTRVLHMLTKLCEKNGISVDAPEHELTPLMQRTDVQSLAQEIEEKLPS